MKLKVIAETQKGEKANLHLKQEDEIKLYGEEFEIGNIERAKELLNKTFDGKPIVEKVKEVKTNNSNRDE